MAAYTNVTVGQMFERHSSNNKKNRSPKNVVLPFVRKIFARKVDINVEIVNKSQDFAQHPVLCYKNKTHVIAI